MYDTQMQCDSICEIATKTAQTFSSFLCMCAHLICIPRMIASYNEFVDIYQLFIACLEIDIPGCSSACTVEHVVEFVILMCYVSSSSRCIIIWLYLKLTA
jgi:hypothetical protein